MTDIVWNWKGAAAGNFNTGRRGFVPIAVVIHVMEGTLEGTDQWFNNPASKVSAHYGVGKNGEIHKYVRETDTAWHAGNVVEPTWKLLKKHINPNQYTIGVEHEGKATDVWTDQLYKTSAQLVKWICSRNNIPLDADHIVRHHEIYNVKPCPGMFDKDHYLKLLNES